MICDLELTYKNLQFYHEISPSLSRTRCLKLQSRSRGILEQCFLLEIVPKCKDITDTAIICGFFYICILNIYATKGSSNMGLRPRKFNKYLLLFRGFWKSFSHRWILFHSREGKLVTRCIPGFSSRLTEEKYYFLLSCSRVGLLWGNERQIWNTVGKSSKGNWTNIYPQ